MESSTDSGKLVPGSPIVRVPGIATRRVKIFERLGLRTVGDLMRHFPRRYDWEADETPIRDLKPDQAGCVRGMVLQCRWVGPPPHVRRGGKGRFEVILQDDGAQIRLTFFNAAYLKDKIHAGASLRAQGKVTLFDNQMQMVNPSWELLDDVEQAEAKEGRLVPVYATTEGITSREITRVMEAALLPVLPSLEDPLPDDLRQSRNLLSLSEAFRAIHFPHSQDEAGEARRRLAYNELLLLQLAMEMKRYFNRTRLQAPKLRWSSAVDSHIRERFPFELTEGQNSVITDLAKDLQRDIPMNRLVHGDVGSGKTVIALYAMLLAVADGRQAALMAPTELLAEQHFHSISHMLEGSRVRLLLLTGSQPASTGDIRKAALGRLATGQVDIVIGTHALASESVVFHNLGVVVVDEQHRFGVLQRAAFRQAPEREGKGREPSATKKRKAGHDVLGRQRSPHYLVMTATPIPRTLGMTVFGDLDISVIEGLPPGRTPIENKVVAPNETHAIYEELARRVKQGSQGYVVVPTIEQSSEPNGRDLKSVRQHADWLKEHHLKDARVGIVHGKLKQATRERTMDRFRRGEIDVLVATTVIEVGVDVPNADMMVIEHAEMFGLAQLHQLRGRIGRGVTHEPSLCVFVAQPTTEDAIARMDAVASTNNGFEIAERDFEIRGMGEFFGTRQHGLTPFRVAQLPDDLDLLRLAGRDAKGLIERDPMLVKEEHATLKQLVVKQYAENLGLVDVG